MSRPRRDLAERLAFFACRRKPVRRLIGVLRRARHPEKWLFVVGCYNSGTTLLHDVLGCHPDVSTLSREGARYTAELPRPEDYGWTRMWAECVDRIAFPARRDPDRARTIVRDWSPLFDGRRRIFLEKSVANLPRMEWFDLNFPNAYFIGIMRNPYAVAEGIRRRARPGAPHRARIGERYPIEMAARQWLVANTMLLDAGQRVARFMVVRYEDLVATPVAVLDKSVQFLGEACPPASFEGGVLSVRERRQPIAANMDAASLARLSPADVQQINDVIGARIGDFGYTRLG